MRLQRMLLPLLCGLTLASSLDARRVRVRPLPQEEEEETIQYYAEPQDDDQRVVYISSADQYNGLYGQQAISRSSQDNYTPSRSSQDNYIPSRSSQDNYIPSRSSNSQAKGSVKSKENSSKAPPVQTIRNYNKVNDDGSFTFGYEAADGSFKEETRGTDCVVRGKYGYVDPDGNKREFTYVSGNPCDPNALKEEEREELAERERNNEPDNGPANYPTRPIRPIRPVTVSPKPAVTLYQNNYQEEEEQPEPEQVLKPVQHIRNRPVYISRPQYESEEEQPQVYQRSRLVQVPSTTPSSVVYKHTASPITITPRPVTASPARSESPATTYRPQLVQVSVTPRPSILYTQQHARPTSSSLRGNVDFDAEFQKFQQENNILAPTPSSVGKPTQKGAKQSSGPIYSSELVYDPATGQYKTQLYQTLPQTQGDFSLNHRIQPYVHQPQHQSSLNVQQLQAQSPLYRAVRPNPNTQAAYQQQQSELQFQNSAQLYAQQQKARSQQTSPQQFYYVQPSLQQPVSYQGGQIDAFLRGHNIQF